MLVPSLVGLASAAATHCAVTAWNNEERRFREEQLSMYHRATITNTPYDAMVITSVRVDNAATAVHAAVSGLVAYRGTGRAPEHASANAPTPLLSSSTRTKQLVVKEDVFVQLAVQNEPRAVETSILGSALPRSLFKQERTSRPSSSAPALLPELERYAARECVPPGTAVYLEDPCRERERATLPIPSRMVIHDVRTVDERAGRLPMSTPICTVVAGVAGFVLTAIARL